MKRQTLVDHGWREVPADNGATAWVAPVSFPRTLYFDLETAYAIEMSEGGILAYAERETLAGLLQAEDLENVMVQETQRRANGGEPRGTYPNY